MSRTDLNLRMLHLEDEVSFRKAIDEFKQYDPDWNFAFCWDDKEDFSAYLRKLENWREGRDLPTNFVTNSFLVGIVDESIMGRVSIRHELNPYLSTYGGHIGYCVVPSCHGRGYATEILRMALEYSWKIGLERVLLTCDENNPASKRVIEKNGGVYDGRASGREVKVPKLRYWISTEKAHR